MKWPRFRILLAGAVLFFVVTGGGALAYFTGTGGMPGHFNVGTLQPVTVAALAGGDAPGSLLLPGGSAAEVILRLSNPNTYDVTLVSVSGNGVITPDSGHSGCAPTGVTFTNQTGLGIDIPPGSSLVRLPGAALMDATSANACQGATFSIPVSTAVEKG